MAADCKHPALTRICRVIGMCPHRVFGTGCPESNDEPFPVTAEEFDKYEFDKWHDAHMPDSLGG